MKAFSILLLLASISIGVLCAEPNTPITPAKAGKAPFRLVFRSYDGDPKTGKIEQFSFQVDTIDQRQPSEFLRLGDLIPNTHFKLLTFVFKTARNAALQEDEDVSELTVVNIITKKAAFLRYNKVVDVSTTEAPGP